MAYGPVCGSAWQNDTGLGISLTILFNLREVLSVKLNPLTVLLHGSKPISKQC